MDKHRRYNTASGRAIPIPKLSNDRKNEYSLKKNFFDPSKNSPPNEFIEKLKLRLRCYESFNNRNILPTE